MLCKPEPHIYVHHYNETSFSLSKLLPFVLCACFASAFAEKLYFLGIFLGPHSYPFLNTKHMLFKIMF